MPRLRTRWPLLLAALSLCTAALAELPPRVRQALQQAQVPPSAVAVLVAPADMPTLQPKLAHREHAAMNPASVMKLLTTYAGLQLLGPDHVWRTRVYTEGRLQGGVLQGQLLLRGGGDPKLVLEQVQALVAEIRAAGVQEVRGDIVLDRSVFEVAPRETPFDDEPLRPYNVAPDGLLMNFGSLIFSFSPDAGSGRARVRAEPPLAGLQLPADVPLRSGPCQDWRSGLQADFAQPLRPRFAGSYPTSCGERSWPLAFAEPGQFAPRMFEALWREGGGRLSGQVRWGQVRDDAQLLLTHRSQPLRELIADINKMSNNVMAQQLFLTLSSELGAPGRMAASRLRLQQWWHAQFAGLPEPVLDNGAGLSREERSSAHALAQLLLQARRDPQAQVFLDSLAIAGVDGTVARLAERAPQSPLIGRAWLKTGSLRDVASVAGYVQGRSGRLTLVVGLVNHPNAGQARPALEQLLEWAANEGSASERPGRKPRPSHP